MTDRLLPSESAQCPTCGRSKEDWGVCSDSFHIPAALPTPDLEGLLDRLERDHTWLLDEQSNPDGTMEDEHRAEKAVTAARTALTDYVSRLEEALTMFREEQERDKAELSALRSERDKSSPSIETLLDELISQAAGGSSNSVRRAREALSQRFAELEATQRGDLKLAGVIGAARDSLAAENDRLRSRIAELEASALTREEAARLVSLISNWRGQHGPPITWMQAEEAKLRRLSTEEPV